jgi:hypothetical protein
MKIATLSTLALLIAVTTAQASSLNPEHVSADAKWVCHVDFEQMRSTKIAAACRAEIQKHEKFNELIKVATDRLGMNPMKDLLGATMYGTGYAKQQGVLLIQCNNLDRKKLTAILKKHHPRAKTVRHGKWTINTWTEKNGDTVAGTFATENTIAICGDADHLKQALDVIGGGGKSLGRDAKLAQGMDKKSVFALRAIDIDTKKFRKKHGPKLPDVKDVSIVWREIKGYVVGEYKIVTDSAETAEGLRAAISGFQGLAKLKVRDKPLAAKLVNGLYAKSKGNLLYVVYKASNNDILAVAEKLKGAAKERRGHHHRGHRKSDEPSKKKTREPELKDLEI